MQRRLQAWKLGQNHGQIGKYIKFRILVHYHFALYTLFKYISKMGAILQFSFSIMTNSEKNFFHQKYFLFVLYISIFNGQMQHVGGGLTAEHFKANDKCEKHLLNCQICPNIIF